MGEPVPASGRGTGDICGCLGVWGVGLGGLELEGAQVQSLSVGQLALTQRLAPDIFWQDKLLGQVPESQRSQHSGAGEDGEVGLGDGEIAGLGDGETAGLGDGEIAGDAEGLGETSKLNVNSHGPLVSSRPIKGIGISAIGLADGAAVGLRGIWPIW